MINIETIGAWGFEGAIRGMRNPYESHERSDSKLCGDIDCDNCPLTSEQCNKIQSDDIVIGENDMTLAKKLIRAGSEHRKFLRMIHVQADVTAPRYWWAEMDKYKYVEANSSSTMHLITKRHLDMDDFTKIGFSMELKSEQERTIRILNEIIDAYNDSDHDKEMYEYYFNAIKCLLPESYNQLRTIDTNYECLLSIYHQRRNHRLPEWHEFCDWIKSLPYMEEFIGAME